VKGAKAGLSTTWITVIAGVVAAALAVLVIIYCCMRKRRPASSVAKKRYDSWIVDKKASSIDSDSKDDSSSSASSWHDVPASPTVGPYARSSLTHSAVESRILAHTNVAWTEVDPAGPESTYQQSTYPLSAYQQSTYPQSLASEFVDTVRTRVTADEPRRQGSSGSGSSSSSRRQRRASRSGCSVATSNQQETLRSMSSRPVDCTSYMG
jgi:hypothetical protein